MISAFIKLTIRNQVFILIFFSILILSLFIVLYSDICFISIKPTLFSEHTPFSDFYEKSLRGYLFSGFLSVGSFLLSLHTFIIINMRDKVYLSDNYKEIFKQANQLRDCDNIEEKELFKPLNNLSRFIHWSIVLSIFTSLSQFTIGLYNSSMASLICVYFAILTILFLLVCLILIRENIKYLLHQK